MTLLDDARRLAEEGFEPRDTVHESGCTFCGPSGTYRGDGPWPHLPDCSWLAMPRIVAALEAAERITGYIPAAQLSRGCLFCEGECLDLQESDDIPPWRFDHDADCPWQALAAAMADESTVTA